MLRSGELFEDFAGGLGPDEGFWVGIMVFQIFHDGALALCDAAERAASDAFSGDLGEEAFDHVEPGRRGRREVQMKARMRLEPAFDGGRLMRGIVVDDEMQIQTGGGSVIDQLEKAQKLTMPVARQAGSDDAAVQHIERREKRRGAVALLVVVMVPARPFFMGRPSWVRSRA